MYRLNLHFLLFDVGNSLHLDQGPGHSSDGPATGAVESALAGVEGAHHVASGEYITVRGFED